MKTSHDGVPSEATTCDERPRTAFSLHPSQSPVRKIGATCHPPEDLPVAADSDSSRRLPAFNAFTIQGI